MRFAVFLVAVTVVLLPSDSPGISLDVDQGVRFEMEIPRGLCQVDPGGSEFDEAFFSTMASLHSGNNKQLALFVDCPTFEAFRSGRDETMSRWSMVLLPLVDGQVKPLRETTRARFIEVLARQFSTFDQALTSLSGLLNERLAEVFKDTDSAVSINEVRSLGVIDRDDTGVYSGLLATYIFDGQRSLVAGVLGMTLVGDYIVSVNFYRPFIDASTFELLLNDTRSTVHQLITTNEAEAARIQSIRQIDGAGSVGSVEFDWNRVVEKASWAVSSVPSPEAL